jgi:hypothetical protein
MFYIALVLGAVAVFGGLVLLFHHQDLRQLEKKSHELYHRTKLLEKHLYYRRDSIDEAEACDEESCFFKQ